MPGPQGGNRPANTPQGIPAAAAGGSGVFADEGKLLLDSYAQPRLHDVGSVSEASTAHATMLCDPSKHSSSLAKTHIFCANAGDDFDDNFGFGDGGNPNVGGSAYNSYAPAPHHQNPQQGFDGPPTSPGAAQPPEILNCSCGLQCSHIMAKTAKNDGRWFYRSVELGSAGLPVRVLSCV